MIRVPAYEKKIDWQIIDSNHNVSNLYYTSEHFLFANFFAQFKFEINTFNGSDVENQIKKQQITRKKDEKRGKKVKQRRYLRV